MIPISLLGSPELTSNYDRFPFTRLFLLEFVDVWGKISPLLRFLSRPFSVVPLPSLPHLHVHGASDSADLETTLLAFYFYFEEGRRMGRISGECLGVFVKGKWIFASLLLSLPSVLIPRRFLFSMVAAPFPIFLEYLSS